MQLERSISHHRNFRPASPGQTQARRTGTGAVRRAIGIAIAAAGALILLAQVVNSAMAALQSSPALQAGVTASLLAGLATGIGALPVLVIRRIERRIEGALFAVAGGLMLGAALFGLLLPALGAAEGDGLLGIAIGGMTGVALIAGLDRLLPHLHVIPSTAETGPLERSCWLLVIAIGLHNVPEGLAVGASFLGNEQLTAASPAIGLTTAIGIAIQNLPEGLIVAMALVTAGASRLTGLGVATLTGLFEPAGALVGGTVAGLSGALLPAAMALAAGAMMFVVAHDIVPNARRHLSAAQLATGMAAGGLAMALLAAVF